MFKDGMLALVGQGFVETLYMTVISTAFAYLIGLPLGLLLVVTDKDGIKPIPWLNAILGAIINVVRSDARQEGSAVRYFPLLRRRLCQGF